MNRVKIAKLTYTIIDPFILQAWVSLHTVLKSASLKSRQWYFLNKPPNILFANISAYTVYVVRHAYNVDSVGTGLLCLFVYLLCYAAMQ